jgi:hypothetical protein
MAVNRNGVTCEHTTVLKPAIREPEMPGHYFVRRSI